MGQCRYCKGTFDYIPGIGVCHSCKNTRGSSSSYSYDSRKEAEAERAKDRAMDWYQYTDQFGNKVRVSRTTEKFEVKKPFWGWMGAFKGNIERRYPNGDLYIGGVDGSLYHGKGKKIWKESGNSYEGDWVYDHRTGKGKFTWASGSYYEGDFVDGKRTGKGKYVWSDGSYYEGDFVDGNFNGYGVRMYSDGCRYEGQFKDDKRHGKGKMTWPNGNTYEGDWREDFQTGKGKFVWPNNGYHEGDFVGGKYHGYGKHLYTDSYLYVGEFRDNGRHGKGVLTAPDGTAVAYYYENDKIVCKVEEATDEIIARIYNATPQKATAEPKVETKVNITTEVKKAAVAPAVKKTADIASPVVAQPKPIEKSFEEMSDQEIWDKLLEMSADERQAYFKEHHELTVPAGTEVIPANCFRMCFELNKVTFNGELREIGEYAFASTRIKSVLVIPKSVEKIGDHAFDMSRTIEKVVLPNNITVGDYAFAFINDLAEVEFESEPPQGVVIGKGAFSRCDKRAMKSKEMINKIKALNEKAFK